TKRERRRIVAQRDSFQRAERIARRKGARRSRNQRVHRNPATLVTPTRSSPGAKSISRGRRSSRNTKEKKMTTSTQAKHSVGTREEWLAARLSLLEAEKDLTHRSDEVARQRQALPWVRIDKDYRFDTDEGSASLADLFKGRTQLLIYHFM